MESAIFAIPVVISSLMTTVAPMAIVMSGGEIDRERLARGVAQLAVVAARSVAEVTYDDLILDDRTGDFSIRGLEVTLPEAAEVPGCKFTVDALTIVSLDRPDTLTIASEADGIEVAPECAAEQAPLILSLLGPEALNVTHYSATSSYHLGDSAFEYSVLFETASAGSVSVNAVAERLHLEIGPYGEPLPAGEITQLEVTMQDTDALLALLPALGIDDDPVAMATGTMTGVLSEGGISAEERALIDSANAELGRVLEDGGAVTLRSGPGASVSFKQLAAINEPQDMITLLQPVFSSALVGADNLIPSDLLKAAMDAPGDMTVADRLQVAEALATGEGAPRATNLALNLLKPLAEDGNPEASLRYATLMFDSGEDPTVAYRFALSAGKAGANGVRSVLDHIESDLSLPEIFALQEAAAGEMPMPEDDVATLRNAARQYAQGRGASRNYGQAVLLATLAAAGGDHSSQLLVERLSKRFLDDPDHDAWRVIETKQAESALQLWADGFGDGFGAE